MKIPLLLTTTDKLSKRIAVSCEDICSIEEEPDYCLVTYRINDVLHRCVKVKESFNDIIKYLKEIK